MRMKRKIYKLTVPSIKKFLYKKCKKRIVKTLKKKKFKKKMINLGFLKLNKNLLFFFYNIFYMYLKINNFFINNIFFLSIPNMSLVKNTVPMTKYNNTNYVMGGLLKKYIVNKNNAFLGTSMITFSSLLNSNDYDSSKYVKRYLYNYNYIINLKNLNYKNINTFNNNNIINLLFLFYLLLLI